MRILSTALFCIAITGCVSTPPQSARLSLNEATEAKLDSIILPQFQFGTAGAVYIIEALSRRSFDLDTSSGRKGVLIILDVPRHTDLARITAKETNSQSLRQVLQMLCERWHLQLVVEHGAVILRKQES